VQKLKIFTNNYKICSRYEVMTDARCHAVVIDWPNITCLFSVI